ncbi:class C beta-lactamase-related serine hydrolase [Microbacterium foliorum]|uniref:Beta-lactamase/D-alanine carboxypeptidase n=1 Tax=Microbacterium foliorum TaxID=104336 RepID=A0A0F0KAQ1_9MICO|nr:serine hydrolase [Microbacterium foliorum]AXL11900.1 class C beta-lactamase-related serine hydrolase [Microbacterium foliorum]KJL17953.1 beta-lactamase/D-alanine carboxypeptidase [Microbacterium foliorum]
MTRAARIRDLIVEQVDATGFVAHGLHVRIGHDVAEYRWTEDVREEIHSVAKAVCVLAAGIAVDEGLVSLDAPVAEYVPDVVLGDGVEEVTLRHLLTMSSGIDLPYSETLMTDWPDLAREFLGRPTSGRVFQYSNASSYTAMAVLATRTGDIVDYLRPRLLDPLGLGDIAWERCPRGRVVAGSGIALRTEEMSRLGRLIRDRGEWEGERLVSAALIDGMHSDWVASGQNPGYERYALAGWDGPGPQWRLHGAHGQLILFAGDAVVTISADDHLGADSTAAFVADLLDA